MIPGIDQQTATLQAYADDLERLRYLKDHRAYLKECLGIRSQDTDFIDDPGVIEVQKEVYGELEDWFATRTQQKTFRKLMVIVPRECMKSSTVTQAFPIRTHMEDPNTKMAISSANHEKMAVQFGRAIRAHWEGEVEHARLVPLFGPYKGNRKWGADEIITMRRTNTTLRDPTLRIGSVDTGLTSGHFDLVILDDPITKEQMTKFGDTWLDRVWSHYISLGYVVQKTGLFVLVATRYADNDLVGRIVETEIEPIVRERVLPGAPRGELPEDFHRYWPRYAHLAGWKAIIRHAEYHHETGEDQTTFPIIWPPERIEKEKQKSAVDVAAQLNNMPALRDDSPIKQVHIDRAWIDEEDVPIQAYDYITLHGDTAWKNADRWFTGKGDWNVLFAVGHWQGKVYLLRGWRSQKATQDKYGEAFIDFLKWAKSDHIRSKIRCYTYDKPKGGFAGDSVRDWHAEVAFEAGVFCPRIIEIDRGGGGGTGAERNRKWSDILGTAGYWQDGRVKIVRGVEGAKELTYQMLTPYVCGHEDEADAFSGSFHTEVFKPRRGRGKRTKARPLAHGSYDKTGKFKPVRPGSATFHHPWLGKIGD